MAQITRRETKGRASMSMDHKIRLIAGTLIIISFNGGVPGCFFYVGDVL